MNIFFLTAVTVFVTLFCSGGAFTPTPTAAAKRCSIAERGSIETMNVINNNNNNNSNDDDDGNSFRSSSTQLSASRRDTLTNAVGAVGVAFLSASTIVPTIANAAVVAKRTTTEAVPAQAAAAAIATRKPSTTCQDPCFTGVWTDPKHPKGYRVLIRKSYTVANMFLSDGVGVGSTTTDNNKNKDSTTVTTNTNTTPKTYNNIGVKVKDDPKKGETYLTFDFSAKGGPKKVVGTVADHGNKIVFPDGNVWTKNVATAVEGVYATDPRVAGEGYRVVIIRKDPTASNLLAVQLNKDQAITATIVKKDGGTKKDGGSVGIQFVFPDKKIVDATYTNNVIRFPFPVQSNASGNTWTKLDEWTKL